MTSPTEFVTTFNDVRMDSCRILQVNGEKKKQDLVPLSFSRKHGIKIWQQLQHDGFLKVTLELKEATVFQEFYICHFICGLCNKVFVYQRISEETKAIQKQGLRVPNEFIQSLDVLFKPSFKIYLICKAQLYKCCNKKKPWITVFIARLLQLY